MVNLLLQAVVTAAESLLLLLVLPRVLQSVVGQQCSEYQSDNPFLPGTSCEDIYKKNPQSRSMSGYYWILNGPSRVYCGMSASTGESCEDIYINNLATRIYDQRGYYRNNNNNWMFCNMNDIHNRFSRGELISSCAGMGGAWRRVASFNVANGDSCPSPWIRSSYDGVNFCIPASSAAGCYSVSYSTNGVSYQRVCGKASGYQKATPDAYYQGAVGIDSYYVDGLSLTHGNPRQHIWTYAVGVSAASNFPGHNCPCATIAGPNPPAFVGSNYYCESGTDLISSSYHLSDILWDGSGCPHHNTCCNGPWFYRDLYYTTQDNIEVRICTDQSFDDEAILITSLELYVQ